jgi:hypothetical protein
MAILNVRSLHGAVRLSVDSLDSLTVDGLKALLHAQHQEELGVAETTRPAWFWRLVRPPDACHTACAWSCCPRASQPAGGAGGQAR